MRNFIHKSTDFERKAIVRRKPVKIDKRWKDMAELGVWETRRAAELKTLTRG